VGVSGIDDHVIHIGFDVLVELSLETGWIAHWYVAPAFFNLKDIVV
jgi:hypothetical protein